MSLRGGPKILSGSHPSLLLMVQIYQMFLLAATTADKKSNQVINTKSPSLQPSKKQQAQISQSVQSARCTAGYLLKTSWRQIERMLFLLVGSSRRTLVRCGRWLKNLELKYMLRIKQSGHLVAEVRGESEAVNKLTNFGVRSELVNSCFLKIQ